ncbi:hypothetical protein HQ560_20090, partial [bacterium]|nr:hypothetical protein [bacterium]
MAREPAPSAEMQAEEDWHRAEAAATHELWGSSFEYLTRLENAGSHTAFFDAHRDAIASLKADVEEELAPNAERRVHITDAFRGERDRDLAPGQWIRDTKFTRRGAFPYQEGENLHAKDEGPCLFVSIDRGPFRLAGIALTKPGGPEALREALRAGERNLTVWCSASQVSKLPPLPTDGSFALDVWSIVTDLKPFASMTSLWALRFDGVAATDIEPLRELTGLRSLHLGECKTVRDLSPLADLRSLTHLSIAGERGARLLPHLKGLTELHRLEVMYTEEADLAPLAGLTKLRHLSAGAANTPSDYSPLAGMTHLRTLYVGRVKGPEGPQFLTKLTRLRELICGVYPDVQSLAPLERLTRLSYLHVRGCTNVRDLLPLAGLTELVRLNLGSLSMVTDLTPLEKLRFLELLGLTRIRNVGSIES